jgi:predicted small metal-binding protein
MEEAVVSKLINCECGQVVRGDTDDELVKNAEEHINANHPEMAGKLSRDDLLGMAEAA